MKKIYFLTFVFLFLLNQSITRAQCSPSFSFTQSANTISFNDLSVAPGDTIISWNWNFGDSSSSAVQNPTFVYNSCGVYVVTLDISTSQGCTSTFADTLLINGVANINISVLIDTTNGDVVLSASPNSPGFNFIWDFSNGGTGAGVTVTNNFPSGAQGACVIFSDNSGACATDTFCTTFNVNINPPACQAGFTYGVNGTTVSFTNTSTAPGDSITGFQWGFGNFQSSTAVNPSTTYPSCGYYIVQLTMNTLSGCSSSIIDTIAVPGQINGSFTYFVDTLSGTVQYFATPNNSSYSFAWDFGDGNFGAGANPSNTYVDGTYSVCVIISQLNSACSADTVCDSVFVSIDSLSCPVSWTNTPSGASQIFNATPFDFNDSYLWDFGDGNSGTGPLANNTYTAPGTYTVCLDYSSATTGCTSQFCDTVVVSSAGCSMQISYVNNGGGNYTFTANVTGGGIFPVVAWIFGDGGTGFGLNPTHQYTANGFNIVCAVLNPPPIPFGCSDTVCTFVLVSGVVGVEEFDFSNSVIVAPNPFSDHINLQFNLSYSSDVKIGIYDVLGNLVQEVADEKKESGSQQYQVSTEGFSSGIYFLKIRSGSKEVVRKLYKY